MATPARLLETIQKKVSASSPDFDIEASAGWARGTYTKLLSGRIKLRVHHLGSLCNALGIPFLSLYLEAYGHEDGLDRLTDLFVRLMGPELERLSSANGSFPNPSSLSKKFQQLRVEE